MAAGTSTGNHDPVGVDIQLLRIGDQPLDRIYHFCLLIRKRLLVQLFIVDIDHISTQLIANALAVLFIHHRIQPDPCAAMNLHKHRCLAALILWWMEDHIDRWLSGACNLKSLPDCGHFCVFSFLQFTIDAKQKNLKLV